MLADRYLIIQMKGKEEVDRATGVAARGQEKVAPTTFPLPLFSLSLAIHQYIHLAYLTSVFVFFFICLFINVPINKIRQRVMTSIT